MRALIHREIDVAAAARDVWAYVSDWSRQGEWIPATRVEPVQAADRVGGLIRAWTGVGPLGFWDPMTITAWQSEDDGSGRCEVLHTGSVVRGEAAFAVRARGAHGCTVIWWEHVPVPGGRVGALAWHLAAPVVEATIDLALRRMRERAVRHAA